MEPKHQEKNIDFTGNQSGMLKYHKEDKTRSIN